MIRACAFLLLIAGVLSGSNLDAVKAEPDPEKRAKAALEHANSAITQSRNYYVDSEYKKAFASLDEVRAATEICVAALDATGKNARRNPKSFKKAEMRINELVRRLRSLEADFGVDDRQQVRNLQSSLEDIHDRLVVRIMGKKN